MSLDTHQSAGVLQTASRRFVVRANVTLVCLITMPELHAAAGVTMGSQVSLWLCHELTKCGLVVWKPTLSIFIL